MSTPEHFPTHLHVGAQASALAVSAARSRVGALSLPIVGLLLVVLLSACDGGGASDAAADAPAPTTTARSAADADATDEAAAIPTLSPLDVGPCDDDILALSELAWVDRVWATKRPEIAAAGAAWQDDARLVQLSAACYLFDKPEIFFVFYSPSAKLWLVGETEADSGEATAALDADDVSFAEIQRWLLDAGYAATVEVVSVDVGDRFAPEGDASGRPFVQVEIRDGAEHVFATFDPDTGTLLATEA